MAADALLHRISHMVLRHRGGLAVLVFGALLTAWTAVLHFATEPAEVLLIAAFTVFTAGVVMLLESRHQRMALTAADRYTALEHESRERRRAEDALRESEIRLQAILDHSPAGIWAKDRHGRYLLANQAVEQVLCANPLGKTDRELFPAEIAEVLERDDGEIFREGQARQFEERLPLADGIHTCLSIKFPLFNDKGEVVAACGIATDITDRKRAEVALREKEEAIRAVVDNALDGIFTVDDAAHLESFNPAAERIFGYESHEVIGKDLRILMPPPWTDLQTTQLLARADGRDRAVVGCGHEVQGQRKDGTVIPLELSLSLIQTGVSRRYVAIVREISERKRAEAALRDSEERYRDLFENASDLILAARPDGRLLYCNRACSKVLGWTADETGSIGWPDFVHADCRESFLAQIERALAGENLEMVAAEFVARDGRRIAVEGTLSGRQIDGRPESVRGIFRDVSERRRTEEALRESEELNRAVLSSLTAHIAVIDREGRIVAVNEAWTRFARANGHRWTTDINTNYLEICRAAASTGDPEAGAVYDGLTRVLKGHQPYFAQSYPCHSPNQQRWFLLHTTVFRSRLGGAVVSHTDISDRVRVEEALRESEERWQLALRGSNDGIWDWDITTGRTLYLARWKDLLGYAEDEILERREEAESRIHPDDATTVRATLDAHFARVTPFYKCEYRMRCRDGTYKWVLDRGQALFDPQGRPLRMVGSLTDITERRLAEDRIRHLNADLEQRHNQMEAANKELEAFTYSVSHDLRAPLRHINGFVELLQKKYGTTFDERATRYLNLIADSARQMGNLIDDLLVFSRMGRTELAKKSVPLDLLVRNVIDSFHDEVRNRRITWEIAPLPVVHADQNMLRLVFVNLLSNAVKYTRPRAEARISVTARRDAHETVVFVRDNGVGFDMQYKDKLFGVFQRLHSAEEFEGTGIGLANVKRIIQRHGGQVCAEGTPGEGAMFAFSLPNRPETAP